VVICVEPGTSPLPRVEKGDGTIHHVVCYGSHDHVISWSSEGERCSEPDCEINHKKDGDVPVRLMEARYFQD